MTRVFLVRHGETEWNTVRRIQGGSSDTPLNEKGRKQKENVGKRLKSETFSAIYASPLQRARETAEAINQYHNLPVTLVPDLREIEAGEMEGTYAAKIGKHLDEFLTKTEDSGELKRLPGGESMNDIQRRAWSAVKSIVRENDGTDVLVVSHYFAILSIICAATDMPLTNIFRFRVTPASISVITFDNGVSRLTLLNENCHNGTH